MKVGSDHTSSVVPFSEGSQELQKRLSSVIRSDVAQAISDGDGEGIKIAVIDSGIETSHPGLAGMQLADDVSITLRGGQLSITGGGGHDVFGHGTAIAGILREIAPKAQIGSFRVLGLGTAGTQAPVVREAVRLALDRGYHVLNCSFGCVARGDLLSGFKNWIDEAYLRNRHIVAAGSNEDSGIVEWPAHFPTVLSVSHVEFGERDSLFYRTGQMVQFGAHGIEDHALWANGQTKRVMGSSFASPRIAGNLARLLSVFPETSPLLAKEALASFSSRWPESDSTVVTPLEESMPMLAGGA